MVYTEQRRLRQNKIVYSCISTSNIFICVSASAWFFYFQTLNLFAHVIVQDVLSMQTETQFCEFGGLEWLPMGS